MKTIVSVVPAAGHRDRSADPAFHLARPRSRVAGSARGAQLFEGRSCRPGSRGHGAKKATVRLAAVLVLPQRDLN
jgi:hypothetical protein